jgi:hypothetical protein
MSSSGQIRYSVILDDQQATTKLNSFNNNLNAAFRSTRGIQSLEQQFAAARTQPQQLEKSTTTFNSAVYSF